MEDAEASALRENLRGLQTDSLRLIGGAVTVVGGVSMLLVLWVPTGGNAPPGAWAASILCFGGGVLAYVLLPRRPALAPWTLVGAVFGGIAAGLLALNSLTVAYLLPVPVVFASVLLGQWGFLLTAGLAGVLGVSFAVGHLGLPIGSVSVLAPVGVNVAVTLACWLSSRNLYTALTWAWNGYERARRNEERARANQAELRRALKALDEASYRLERASYMFGLARDQAEEARRLKQQFSQTISHELRTPLNLIVGFTELMTQSPEYYGRKLPAAYARDLSIVHRNACHLQSLVNDVLDLARIEVAQLGLLPEEVEPAALVQEAVITVRSLVESRGLRLEVDIQPGLPRLWIDPTRIRQVLFNLLNNAGRYTEQGSITVRARQDGQEVIFAVADTGVGIAAEDMARIFEEFRQVDEGTRRRHGGAGLGLAISKRFVELHGGRIWVESRVGEGSTFSFSLPLNPREPVTPGAQMVRAVPISALGGSQERILLAVTSSPGAATLLARYIHGWRTVVVRDLEQARQVAPKLVPQAIVIDTAGGPPAQAPSELARAWGLPGTLLIACPLPGEEDQRQRLAVEGYLAKPVSQQSVLDVVRRFGREVDRVLVIDDDPDFVRLLSRILESPPHCCQVAVAYDGREAIALGQQRRPDLILLDVVLPDMPGSEVIERLRADPALRAVPIIIVSGQWEVDTVAALPGDMVIGRANGLATGEVVQWIRQALAAMGGPTELETDARAQTFLTPGVSPMPPAEPVR